MKMILFCAISVVLMAGCQTVPPSVFCEVAQPITYSRNDTPETRAQIVEHNAAWTELCR